MEERTIIARGAGRNGELQLQRRGADVYELICNGVFLMASYNEFSAVALARCALARLPVDRAELRVLVGGLGMGYTLAAVLTDPRVCRVDVVEIEPLIVHWNRVHLGALAGHPLADRRVRVIQSDLARCPGDPRIAYDALLLDVDNSPDWLTMDANAWLYSRPGLDGLKSRLAEGGVLAIWSAEPSCSFVKRLNDTFGNVSAETVRDRVPGPREVTATLYLAQD